MCTSTLVFVPGANHRYASRGPHQRPMSHHHHPPGHYEDDEDEYSGDDDEEDYSNSEISSEGDDYSLEERSLPPPEASDFLQFGSSLQVKGKIMFSWI